MNRSRVAQINGKLALLAAFFGLTINVLPANAATSGVVQKFSRAAAPSSADWQYFHQLNPAARATMWDEQVAGEKHLRQWTWQWRLGWVQACAQDKLAYCSQIFKEALSDKAMVVRAEAATKVGMRYEGTANTQAVKLLSAAFANPKNTRNTKPLYVQRRILFALNQIGGAEAKKVASQLASSHADTQDYWMKIARIAP